MTPTLEEFLAGIAEWRGFHERIAYKLCWHGRSDYRPQGIWNWYLILPQEQFYPEDWEKIALTQSIVEYYGRYHESCDYDNFIMECPWTYGRMEDYLGRDGHTYAMLTIGVDYAHIWNDGSETKDTVEYDCKKAIEQFIKLVPNRRIRCDYSGKWSNADELYTAHNGRLVRKDKAGNFSEDKWPGWLPAETVKAEDA